MSIVLDQICQFLGELAPLSLAEEWDNVGLLVGRRSMTVERVMTCLTLSPDVAEEAADRGADLVVSHHPIPFRPVRRLTDDTVSGSVLLALMASNTAVYSAHTAFDSAEDGINQRWSSAMGLRDVRAIQAAEPGREHGAGRFGRLADPMTAEQVFRQCGAIVGADNLRYVGDFSRQIQVVGFACGSGGSFAPAAKRVGCDLLVTGEATFHDCLSAEAEGLLLGLLGHYRSERFAMEAMAERIRQAFPALDIWPSEHERDPVKRLT